VRAASVECVLSLAAKLRLSIVTTASAAVIYHKCSCFLEKSEFDQYVSEISLRAPVDLHWRSRKTLASTSLSLACKYEEEHVKIRDLINVTHR
jgi:hypothetical protein